ncbi:MAG: nucleotidyl transferase AbiEii/AbiGii toxin family protein [Candidatus Omnitrophota bacterium]
MKRDIYSILQVREVFHLEFLRWFTRKLQTGQYALKGGVNLRLFFGSVRYSEDMDIDVKGTGVERIKKTVMDILETRGFADSLNAFGIERVVSPDLLKAKQTETTQRFKIHLITSGGEDLFTKIEFSRRGFSGPIIVEPVSAQILRSYKMTPLLVPHYDANAAIRQKIHALAQRSVLQPRDIFDLFVLHSRYEKTVPEQTPIDGGVLKTALANIFQVEFPRFRDAVVAYLDAEDQKAHDSPASWDEVKIKTAQFLEELQNEKA